MTSSAFFKKNHATFCSAQKWIEEKDPALILYLIPIHLSAFLLPGMIMFVVIHILNFKITYFSEFVSF